MDKQKAWDLIIAGGGASGLYAALTAARMGIKVLVLEQKERTGKKILITGNGRCNLGNRTVSPESYPAPMRSFTAPALGAFSVNQLTAELASIGIALKSRGDYLYPRSDQAVSVADALELSAREAGAVFLTNAKVMQIKKDKQGFAVTAGDKMFTAKTVLLACGSKAAPKTGSDGSGYELAKSLGLPVNRVIPALTPLICADPLAKVWAGVRTNCRVSITADAETISDTGEIQLTDFGISGIPVFQVSRLAVRALAEHSNVAAELDFLPEYTKKDLREFLACVLPGARKRTLEQLLEGLLPKKVIRVLARKLDVSEKEPAGELGDRQILRILELAKNYRLSVTGYKDFSQAQVCQGGVTRDAVDPETLMARKIPGLFLAGEILDVDGPCGGMNLMWAWASGRLAAVSVSAYLAKRK